jgi:hypothetical protein
MRYLKTWTAGLKPEEVNELVKQLEGAQPIWERLSSILDQRVKASVDKQLSFSTYESPNWAYVQADAVGYQRAIKEILELIKERNQHVTI